MKIIGVSTITLCNDIIFQIYYPRININKERFFIQFTFGIHVHFTEKFKAIGFEIFGFGLGIGRGIFPL